MPPSDPPTTIPSHRVSWALLFLLGMGLFFYRGTLDTPDEVQMALTTQAIVERGSLQFERETFGRWTSGYGIGTPILGIPFYLATRLAMAAGWMGRDGVGLFSMGSLLCLVLCGLALARLTGRPGLSALVLATSPVLPGALAAYSENLSAVSLLFLVWSLSPRPPRGAPGVAFLSALFGVLARSAMLPFLGLAALWGIRQGADRRSVAGAFAGMALGAVITLAVNHFVQGDLLQGAYVGQDFTTPAVVGVFGLLFSPERGLVFFWPIVLLPLASWRDLSFRGRSFARLGYVLLGFSLVFHGTFWAWHGGWSAGPRFMIPMIALLCPAVVEVLALWPSRGGGRRLASAVLLAWGAVMALIYATHNPMAWWTILWAFHREENVWLGVPQASLWVAALGGWAEPARARLFPASMAAGGAMAVAGAVGLLRGGPWRAITALEVPWRPLAPLLAALALVAVAGAVRGPRGWMNDAGEARLFMVLDRPGHGRGIFDKRIDGPVLFRTRAVARYAVVLDGAEIVAQREPVPRHVTTTETNGRKGLFPIEVVAEANPGEEFLFALYSTWSGSGVWTFPLGGEYVLPRPLTTIERLGTGIWRKRAIILALSLALAALLPRQGRSRPVPGLDGDAPAARPGPAPPAPA